MEECSRINGKFPSLCVQVIRRTVLLSLSRVFLNARLSTGDASLALPRNANSREVLALRDVLRREWRALNYLATMLLGLRIGGFSRFRRNSPSPACEEGGVNQDEGVSSVRSGILMPQAPLTPSRHLSCVVAR